MTKWLMGVGLATALFAVGCGKAEIGESCDTTGSTDECVDGAVCDTDGTNTTCFKTCTADSECAATENCTGVSGGNLKRCKTK